MANTTNMPNAPVPDPNAQPRSFHLYTGSGKTPLVLQVFAGLMWLSGLAAILQGIPLLLFFGLGIIPIVLGVLIIKYARGIFKMEAKGYKGVFILNTISVLFLVATKLASGWPFSVDFTFIVQLFAAGLTLLIFYLYKPKFGEAVKTFFWDKIILVILAVLVMVFGSLYFYQKPKTEQNNNADTTPTTQLDLNRYTNTKFGYSLMYPKIWNYTEGAYNQTSNFQNVDFGGGGTNDLQNLSIDNYQNDGQITLKNYAKSISDGYSGSSEQSLADITINGKSAVQLTMANGDIFTFFYRQKDNEIFTIHLWYYQPIDIQAYNQILDSFRY